MKAWFLLIIWCALIFSLSSIPSAKISEQDFLDFIIRKAAHITEYFILFLLAFNAIKKTWNLKTVNIYIIATIFSLLYAASDEFHQSFVPGRGPSIKDVGIDFIGIILGNIYIWKFLQKTPKIIKKLLK